MKNTWLYAVVAVSALLSLYNPLAEYGALSALETTEATGKLFLLARGASGALAVAQDADIGGSAFATFQLSPGQVLTPVLEQLNRFADTLFLVAIISSIISLLLPAFSQGGALVILIVGLLVIATTFMKIPGPLAEKLDGLCRASVQVGIVLALILPFTLSVSMLWGDFLTRGAWNEASESLDSLTGVFSKKLALSDTEKATVLQQHLAARPGESSEGTETLFGRWKEGANQIVEEVGEGVSQTLEAARSLTSSLGTKVLNIVDKTDEIYEAANGLFLATVNLAVTYLVKLIVIPVLLSGAFLYVFRRI